MSLGSAWNQLTSDFDNAFLGRLSQSQIDAIAQSASNNVAAAGGSIANQTQAYQDVVTAAEQPVTDVTLGSALSTDTGITGPGIENALGLVGHTLTKTADYVIIIAALVLAIELFR